MKAPLRNILFFTVLLTLCALLARLDTAEPSSDGLRDFDWWKYASRELLESGIGYSPEEIARIESLLKVPCSPRYPTLDETKGPNELCWSIALWGRSEFWNEDDVVRLTDHQDWQVRSAAHMALARRGFYQRSAQGLSDSHWITVQADERKIGEGGTALRCQPVVLATQRGLADGPHDITTVASLLAGLRVRSLERTSYDSTPEPFPDVVTMSCPDWFVRDAAGRVQELGWQAVPELAAQYEYKEDFAFVSVSGGRGERGAVDAVDPNSVHRFCRVFLYPEEP
jgi:hypothetical protein